MKVSKAAVVAGIALAIAMLLVAYLLQRLAFPDGGGPFPLWYSISSSILTPLQGVVPGLAAGWLAGERALGHGTIVAFGSTLASGAIVLWSMGLMPVGVGVIGLTVGLLISIVTQCIGALAGVALRTRGAAVI